MDSYYEKIADNILSKYTGKSVPSNPTALSEHVYIGGQEDAENTQYLNKLGITHIINMAAYRLPDESPYSKDSGIVGYKQFDADDSEFYNILKHFEECKKFIDDARKNGGKTLVHCAMGINRSGAICVAYLMVDEQKDLFEILKRVKEKRHEVLFNKNFQKQLISFAKEYGLLSPKHE